MPVAYLEPHLNEFNAFSVYTTKTPRERSSEFKTNVYSRMFLLCNALFLGFLSSLFVQSPGSSQCGSGVMSWHPTAGPSAKGDWRLGRVGGPLYWDASRHWNHSSHAVQLPATVVGERTWKLSWGGGSTLHRGHFRTPESTSGKHHENCSQQSGYWWSLLDEEIGWWALGNLLPSRVFLN